MVKTKHNNVRSTQAAADVSRPWSRLRVTIRLASSLYLFGSILAEPFRNLSLEGVKMT